HVVPGCLIRVGRILLSIGGKFLVGGNFIFVVGFLHRRRGARLGVQASGSAECERECEEQGQCCEFHENQRALLSPIPKMPLSSEKFQSNSEFSRENRLCQKSWREGRAIRDND